MHPSLKCQGKFSLNWTYLNAIASGVSAIDEISFERSAGGTIVDYTADIRLGGVLRLIQPFLGGAFANLGRNAVEGMQRELDERAASAPGGQA